MCWARACKLPAHLAAPAHAATQSVAWSVIVLYSFMSVVQILIIIDFICAENISIARMYIYLKFHGYCSYKWKEITTQSLANKGIKFQYGLLKSDRSVLYLSVYDIFNVLAFASDSARMYLGYRGKKLSICPFTRIKVSEWQIYLNRDGGSLGRKSVIDRQNYFLIYNISIDFN